MPNLTSSQWSLYDPLPNGSLCWATAWEDEDRHGWWVQHGGNREARRFFPANEIQRMFQDATTDVTVLSWLHEAHTHRPCQPKRLVRPGGTKRVVYYA